MRRILAAISLLAVLLWAATPARADAIDGNWCHPDGRQMSIRGPAIVTPGGTEMRGDYDRHGFAYTVPAGERGAGDNVIMVQIDEYTVQVWRGAGAAAAQKNKAQVWHRCSARTS